MSTPQTKCSAQAARITPLQAVTLILSIYVLLTLLVQSMVPLAPATTAALDRIDFWVCMVFMADFFIGFYRAPSKTEFLKWGWIDLVSSIPVLDMFRVGRVFRIIRIFRVLRAFRSGKNLLSYLLRERKTTSLAAVGAIALMLLIFSSVAMLQFETSPDANIKTPIDAFWWAYSTMATVGYGDKFPVSLEGRVVACILMTAGVGLFGIFTGFVASLFVEPELKQEENEIQQLTREVQALSAQVQLLQTKLNNQGPKSFEGDS
jgi:voltage-gated potassium channel